MKFLTYDDIEPYAKRIPNGSWWRPVPGHDWDIWLRACIEKHEPKEAVMDYSGIVDFRNDDSYELSEIQIIIAGEYAGVKGYINISVDDQSVAHMPHGIQETWKSVRRDTGKKVWPYEQIIIGPIIEYVRQYAVLTKEEQGREITSILRRYGCCMPPDYLLLDPCDVNKRVGWQMNELKQYFHEYRISSQMEFAMIDGKCCKIPESMHDPEENVEMPPLADRISYEVNRSLGLDEQFGILYPAVCNGFGGVAVMMSPFSISELLETLSIPLMEKAISSGCVDNLFFVGRTMQYAVHVMNDWISNQMRACLDNTKSIPGAIPLLRKHDDEGVCSFGIFLPKENMSESRCRELAVQVGAYRKAMNLL